MTEQHDEPTVYAERMFPAPVDHGIAREDRAMATVASGVDTAELGVVARTSTWYQGGGRVGEKAVQRIIDLPADPGPARPRATRSSR